MKKIDRSSFGKKNFIDLISLKKIQDKHTKRSIQLWGNTLHNKNELRKKNYHIENVMKALNIKKLADIKNYLEIGCGEGSDLFFIKKKMKLKNIFCVDIGRNIESLSKIKFFKKINFIRCDCLDLPFKNNYFDFIYSYGVFHHTKNFTLALINAKRVLNKGGALVFYNYKKQSNFIKRIGVYFESILLMLFLKFNIKTARLFCYLISPIILIIFSYPSLILKIFGSKKLYKKFPLWWGRSPNTIIGDLMDRLYAPVNIRFSKNEMVKILKTIKFNSIKVVENNDGLFCIVKK